MTFWTDKSGNKLTLKQFMARWKDGISKVTPIQQMKSQLVGYMVVLTGIIWGIVIAAIMKTWWLLTVLSGSLIISSMSFIGMYQKYNMLSKIEKGVIFDEKDK